MAKKMKATLYSRLISEANKTPILDSLETSGMIDMMFETAASKNPDKKFVLSFSYDHMDESGSYVGATGYRATITPSLAKGITVKVAGKHADIRSYLEETLLHHLMEKV